MIFRMVIKAGAGICSFGYTVTMRIETETDTRFGIRGLALDDELKVATIILLRPRKSVFLVFWGGGRSCFKRETRRW